LTSPPPAIGAERVQHFAIDGGRRSRAWIGRLLVWLADFADTGLPNLRAVFHAQALNEFIVVAFVVDEEDAIADD
jgi:hypothetical protein